MAEYITSEGVFCKGCGTKLVRIEDGVGVATPQYSEMEIVFDDGTKHITPMCVACVSSDSLDLNDIYQSDVERWDKELKQAKQGKVSKEMRNRAPVKMSKYIDKTPKVDKTKNRRRGSLRR